MTAPDTTSAPAPSSVAAGHRPLTAARLAGMAGPIALSRMSVMLMSFTDAIVLGRYTVNELPFILNAWLPIGVAVALAIGVLQGVQILSSELIGRGKAEETGRIARRGLIWASALGVLSGVISFALAEPLFAAVGFEREVVDNTAQATRILALGLPGHAVSIALTFYLEAHHQERRVTWVMMGAVALNLLASLYLVAGLMGGPSLGFEGVAWATTGVRYVLTAALILIALRTTPLLKASPPAPQNEAKRQAAVGAGASVSNVAEFSAFNLTFVFATLVSLEAATAYGMAIQFVGVTFMGFLGLATATSVEASEAFGRGDRPEVRRASRLGVQLGIGFGLALSPWLLVFPNTIAGAVLADPAAAALLATLLPLAALVIAFDGLQAVGAYALRAQEVVWAPSLIHLGSYYAIMVPGAVWLGLAQGGGAAGILAAVIVATLVAGSLQVLALELRIAPQGSRRAALGARLR